MKINYKVYISLPLTLLLVVSCSSISSEKQNSRFVVEQISSTEFNAGICKQENIPAEECTAERVNKLSSASKEEVSFDEFKSLICKKNEVPPKECTREKFEQLVSSK